MKNRIEMIKQAAYVDELKKISSIGSKMLSGLGKRPTLSGLGIGSTFGAGINVGELYYRKSHPKTKKDKTITNKKILGSAISGAIGGGLTGAYIGNMIGMFKRINHFNPNDFKYNYNSGFSSQNRAPLNTVGKQFEDSLHKVKTKSDASKIFRSHVMQHHPDKGGKTENIQAINSAWENFKKYKFDKLAFFKFINEQSYKNELTKLSQLNLRRCVMNQQQYDQIVQSAFEDEMKKIAEKSEEKNVGYLKGLIGSARARAHGDKLRHLVNKGEYIKGVYSAGLKKEVPVGAGIGAASIGALAGVMSKKPKTALLGAGIGALAGGVVGGEVAGLRFDKSYLRSKGIKDVPGGYHFTDEARKKYRV